MNTSYDRSIISAVQKMTGTYNIDTVYLVTGNVVSVDENAGTCLVEAISGNASTNIDGVEFQTVVADGVLFIPRVGSEVKVLFSKYTTPFIAQYSEIENMYIAADLIQFNDGALGGMVKVIDLTTKLNNLENDVNNLKTLLTTMINAMIAVPSGNVSHTELIGYFSPLLSYTTDPLTPTVRSDIENTVITQ